MPAIEALLVDWDNVANFHPGWKPEFRYAPQRALGSDGRAIAILWTNTVAFQKLQRLAHDDITLDDYLAFVAAQRGDRAQRVFAFMPATPRFSASAPAATAPRKPTRAAGMGAHRRGLRRRRGAGRRAAGRTVGGPRR